MFNSRGSLSSLARMTYNIPKGLITGEADKTVMDFLPAEAGKISDASIEISINQHIGINLHFIKAGFNLKHFAKAEMKKSSDFCGGSSEASQTVGQSLDLYIDIPYVGTYTQNIDDCQRVLGRVCASPFGNKSDKRRRLSNSERKSDISILSVGEKSGSCRIVNAISSFLQFLDCFKANNKNSIDYMPLNAVFDWEHKSDSFYFVPCQDCQFIIPPFDYNFKIQDGSNDQLNRIWGSIGPHEEEDEDEDYEQEFDLSSIRAAAFGEPHIITFSGDSILANEVGDFYLIKFEAPYLSSDYCKEMGSLNEEQRGLGKELESYNSSEEFMGAQIRFLPGAWSTEMTMSVALGVKFRNEEVEILQLLNEPHFDVKILVNRIEYQNDTILTGLKIRKLTETLLKGDSGSYVITSKYFSIIWSPFTVSISLSSFITNTGRNGNGCAIKTEGLMGSWETQTLRYRFGNEVNGVLDPATIKNFVNSWRVTQNESIISNWLPLYSDNNTKSFDPPVLDLNNLAYLETKKECSKIGYDILGKQLDLLNKSCLNIKLNKLNNMTNSFIEGCAYDYWVTKKRIFLDNLRKHLTLIKLHEPIACFAPLKLLFQKEINTTINNFYLKIFDSNITKELLSIEKELLFKMEYWLENKSNIIVNLFDNYGSLFIDLKKAGEYYVKIGGVFKRNNTLIDLIDVNGNFSNEPGTSYAEILIRFIKNENSNYSKRIFYVLNILILVLISLCL